MSIKAKKSQVNYPRAVQQSKPQGIFHPNYDGGFFQTEPRIAYGNNRSSSNQHAISNSYVQHQRPQEKVVAYPMNASFVDRPSHSIYAAGLPKEPVLGYINPPARLDDGLFKKLYTGSLKDSPYPTGKKTQVERDLEKHRATNKSFKRDHSMPLYSNRLPEQTIFDDPKFVNYLNSQNPQKSSSLASSPILKKSTPRRTPPPQLQEYSGLSNQVLQQSQSVRNNNVPQDFRQNMFKNDYVLPPSNNPSIGNFEHFKTEGNQSSQPQRPAEDKYHVAKEIISPTYQKSTFGRGTRRWPLMEDTAKMRNPMFHTHDFADYEKSNLLNKPKFKDTGYSYADALPVGSNAYLKQHKVTIAQVDADNHPVNHSFKVDASFGILPITDAEKRSIGDLKQRNAQHFHSTQILRKNLALDAVNNSFNGSMNSLNRSRNNLDLPTLVSDRLPNEANKHNSDYTRSYGNSPMLSSFEREHLKTNARFKAMPMSPQANKMVSPPW